MSSPCEQKDKILSLQYNSEKVMEILTKLEKKVDEIHTYIFQWEMAKNYVSREIFDLTVKDFESKITDKEDEIKYLKANQNKVARLIISTVILAVLALIIIPKV